MSIGTGIEQVVVTSVLYKDESTAKQTLEGLGLVVEVEYDDNSATAFVSNNALASGKTYDFIISFYYFYWNQRYI